MSRADRAPDPDAFAALICDWCLEVAPGQRVLVDSTTLAEPLALALHRAVLERDAWAFVRLVPASLGADFHRYGQERHRTGPPPTELALVEGIDSVVRIDAPANTNELAGIDPARIAQTMRAREPLMKLFRLRRWCGPRISFRRASCSASCSRR